MPALRPSLRRSGNASALPPALWESRLLRACRGAATDRVPVWLMRQAGRYMAQYRAVRARGSFLDLCRDPAACAEVALYARDTLAVDAAIVFSDILVVLEALGMGLAYDAGEGPRLSPRLEAPLVRAPLRTAAEAADRLSYVAQAVRLTVAGLPEDIPCIGFVGGPFTLASYAIEGGASRQFTRTKAALLGDRAGWQALLTLLADTAAAHARAQIAAGAACVQIFESWVGCLDHHDFTEAVVPALVRLVDQLPAGIPVILYASGSAHLAHACARVGCDVLSIDTTGDLAAAFTLAHPDGTPLAVQGNLDPAALLAPPAVRQAATDRVLAAARGRSGYIFNLGHGILKETDPEQARALVAHVQDATSRA